MRVAEREIRRHQVVLVEVEDSAVELGTSVQTLRNWIKKYGWRRHPQAPRAVPKLPPEKEGPARRIYELTPAGARLLEVWATALRATGNVVAAFLGRFDHKQRRTP